MCEPFLQHETADVLFATDAVRADYKLLTDMDLPMSLSYNNVVQKAHCKFHTCKVFHQNEFTYVLSGYHLVRNTYYKFHICEVFHQRKSADVSPCFMMV
jgi:hypothetical protein